MSWANRDEGRPDLMGTTLLKAVATTGASGTATGVAGTDFGKEGFTGDLALGVAATFGVGGWGLEGAVLVATGFLAATFTGAGAADFLVWTGLFDGVLAAGSLDGGFLAAETAFLAIVGAGLPAGFLAAVVEVAVGLAIDFLAVVARVTTGFAARFLALAAGAATGFAAGFLGVLVAVAGALAAVDWTALAFWGALAGFTVLAFTTGLLTETRDLGSGPAVWPLSFGRATPASSARECTGLPAGKPTNLRSDANI